MFCSFALHISKNFSCNLLTESTDNIKFDSNSYLPSDNFVWFRPYFRNFIYLRDSFVETINSNVIFKLKVLIEKEFRKEWSDWSNDADISFKRGIINRLNKFDLN